MILPPEYRWLESYLDNDSLWLEDSLNWEEAFDLILSDFTLYSFLTTPFFYSSYFFIDYFTKISFLDIMFLMSTDKKIYSRELFDLFIWDMTAFIQNNFLPAQFFFYTDYQDFIIMMLYYSPELILAFNDYVNIYWVNAVINYSPSIVFDLFSDSLNTSISEFTENLLLFFSFTWAMILFINIFNINKWNNPIEIYVVRLAYYMHSIAKESRLQYEALMQTVFFFFFYWTMMIATFDDDKEELIELFDVNCFFFFFFFYYVFIF